MPASSVTVMAGVAAPLRLLRVVRVAGGRVVVAVVMVTVVVVATMMVVTVAMSAGAR
jgi:hypothetical protein